MDSIDSFGSRREFSLPDGSTAVIYDILELARQGIGRIDRLPYSIKLLLENLLRHEDGVSVTADDIQALARWDPASEREISFMPARVLLQDFTGVPAVVDLAAMRDAMKELGGDPARINPLMPSELVIDHSVQVDSFGRLASFLINAEKEFERNRERYAFLRWGKEAFENFKVVPPDTGIVHQVNIEYLARVVFDVQAPGERLAYPDTLVGTDSHTTMVNGLGVLGWGVGGIEAEAAMLGQPISFLVPEVVGFRLRGELPEGATATDAVLRVTEMLRAQGVVGKYVEFFGEGLDSLSLADRATIGNMSPEFGSTCAIFPIDPETLAYLRFTGRPEKHVALVEAYAREQGLFHTPGGPEADYTDRLELDLASIEPSLAGPKLPQQRIILTRAKESFLGWLRDMRDGDLDGGSGLSGSGATASTVGAAGSTAVAAPAARRAQVAWETPEGDPVEFELRDGADRRYHQLHQHLKPERDGRRRAAGTRSGQARSGTKAVGEDQPGPRIKGRDRVPDGRGPHAVPREARLPPGRIRLHHVHRKQRPARPAHRGCDTHGGPRRVRRTVGQPKLRGPNQPEHQGKLPGFPTPRSRICARRPDGHRPAHRAHRPGPKRG